ncbi:uncharacterized protein LOC141680162 [Apium graveolens]|uniref:uncharacterized protein LOC141680162 n=1 Tax=Apium graveolens TaxID=4045 RepID=UPI003D799CC1
MLYWGEDEKEDSCKTCGLSRWIVCENKGTSDSNLEKVIHKVPANVMRYFPLKPRLQRLFMCKDFSELMVWHAVGRQRDGKLRHPADAETWKTMDARYSQFSSENRNIRLGLTADGFNPFRTMNTNHSTWPIVLVNYNLPPWLCMKPENLILSTLISGPDSPKNSIDVYMQPLVAELTELWNEGIQTYDAFTDQTFILRASILWTISDFPGYAMKFLDPDHKWRFDKRRFNGQIEMRQPPAILSGTDIEDLLSNFQNQFGKKKKEPGRKKLNMAGKTKDHVNARLDLQELGIRKALHHVRSLDGKHLEIRAAVFDMTNKEKDLFCAVLKNVKLPYGSASNISRYVHTKERKISGYKSHDAHFLLHYLLQFAVKKSLKPEVATVFIRLGAFLRGIWSKVIDLNELRRLQQEIVEILCQFKNIFVNAFFDIMSYVRNRSKPEGSIAEGYLAEEGLPFCSRFLGGDSGSKITKPAKFGSCPEKLEYHIGTRRNKDGKSIHLKESQWMAIHRYILFNNGNKEIESLIEEHRALVAGQAKLKRYKREREHNDNFWKWMKEHVTNKLNISRELEVLAMGPNRVAKDSKDENPTVGNVNYYGAIEEIVEVDYWGEFSVVVFKCCWYQEEKDVYGLTRVNFNKLCQQSDPYVLASQVQQIFYIEDPVDKMLYNVIKRLPRDWCDVENDNVNKGQNDTGLHDIHLESQIDEASWCRDDVPKRQVPIHPDEGNEPA